MKTRLLTAAAAGFGLALLFLAAAAWEESPHAAEQDLIRQGDAQLAVARGARGTPAKYDPLFAATMSTARQAGDLCFARRQRHTAEVWLARHAGGLAALLLVAGLIWPGAVKPSGWPSPRPSPAMPTPPGPGR